MSELLSIALFLTSVVIYALKAGRNTWWFAATLTVLGLFVVLNITLYASDYFTGDGINDAVLYTLTNSLTGAGVSKYILPGVGLVAALVTVFSALGWVLRRRRHHPHHFGYSLLALVLALASVDASPAFRQISELVKSQSRDGDPDFIAYYKEPAKSIPNPKLNLVYIYGESLERTYFDNDAFPDLTPELGKLKTKASISATPPSFRVPITPSLAWWLPSAVFLCLRRLKATPPPRSPASSRRISASATF
ncbi:phosphoglycerol transferase I [Raoultella ornithinolytica]|nr:phosphoglycerol transferase I [Raoultella ornithinolytica]